MKMGGRANFGYGRSLRYAVKNILLDKYGDGNFKTRASHAARMAPFIATLKDQGIRDLCDVSTDVVLAYASQLRQLIDEECIAVCTATQRLSTVNVVMRAARGDAVCSLSPRTHIGARSRVRKTPPMGLSADAVLEASSDAIDCGYTDIGGALILSRFVGTRIREAALLDLKGASITALEDGVVVLVRGSKGGRAKTIPRVIHVSRMIAERLNSIESLIVGPNLIRANQTFNNWYLDAYRRFGGIAKRYGLHTGWHDLRAAYACSRYKRMTGYDAPCVVGHRAAPRTIDQHARTVLATELGHSRIDVVGCYVGGRR